MIAGDMRQVRALRPHGPSSNIPRVTVRPRARHTAARHRHDAADRDVVLAANRGGDASTSGENVQGPGQESLPQERVALRGAYRTLGVFGNREALNSIDDLNQLQTALMEALKSEEYALAALVRDRIKAVMGSAATRIDWGALGLPTWISDRVERLGYPYPSEIQRRAAPVIMSGLDAVIQSETGSGKTLAFLAPALSVLQYPPEIFMDDLQGPQAIIVVPSLELGVQCALLVYKLFGGNLSQRRPGDPANMFTYDGPRNILVRGLLNKEEVAMAKGTDYLKGVHVVVATAPALMEVYSGQDRRPVLDHLKILAVDEYDECMRAAPEAMAMMLSCACQNNVSQKKPQVVLVGATITSAQIEVAAQAKWIKEPVHVLVGKEGSIPSGLQHRYVLCEPGRKLAVLARLLRQDLELLGDDPLQPARAMVFANSAEEAATATEPLRSALWGDHQMAVLLPPGTRIPPPPGSTPELPQDKDEAKTAAQMELAGSSPFSASDPIRAMHSFRDNRTSLLLCTPQAARGLDLPAVSHVYNLGVPSDPTQYLHRAGRAGRIGSTSGGIVTTLVTEDELEALQNLAAAFNIDMVACPAPDSKAVMTAEGADVEVLRKGLEDVYNLM